MSLAAMLWALNDAPVSDPTEAFVLVALADNAWDDGHGAFPSIPTIARRVRCSERTVQRHLRALEDGGIISRGDQALAARFGRYAPVVYDLAMTLVRGCAGTDETPSDAPRQGCQIVTPDDSSGDTGVTAESEPRGDARVTAQPVRGDTESPSGVTPVSPNPRTNPPSTPGGTTTSRSPARKPGPPFIGPPSATTSPGRPPGWDEYGPLVPRCRDHLDLTTVAGAPSPACRVCGEARDRWEAAEPKRDQARRIAAGRAATQTDRATRAEAAKVDVTAQLDRARKALHGNPKRSAS